MAWREEFADLMSVAHIEPAQLVRARAIRDANLPDKLYKFRTVNKKALNNLRTDTVWLCPANTCNDPYECAFTIDYGRLASIVENVDLDTIFERTVNERHRPEQRCETHAISDPARSIACTLMQEDKNIAPEGRESIITALLPGLRRQLADLQSQNIDFAQRTTKVCSFSTRLDSPVMWAHYAKNHAGFCLEYDFSRLPRTDIRRGILYPVIYSSDLVDATEHVIQSMSGCDNLFAILAAIRKSRDWSYEDEWRFVLLGERSFSGKNYSMPTPLSLLIGAGASADDEMILKEIGASKGIHVYKMRPSSYKIAMEPVLLTRST